MRQHILKKTAVDYTISSIKFYKRRDGEDQAAHPSQGHVVIFPAHSFSTLEREKKKTQNLEESQVNPIMLNTTSFYSTAILGPTPSDSASLRVGSRVLGYMHLNPER